MLVPWAALNYHNPNTSECAKGAERKWCRLAADKMRASMERVFQAYGRPLNLVKLFKYLGRY